MNSYNECRSCFRHCRLMEGQTGFCHARKNIEGRILDINYGKLTAMTLDPMEKHFRMFRPESKILCVGSFGCNLACPFCQSYTLSTMDENDEYTENVGPEELTAIALQMKSRGNIGIAFTYNEPLVGWEYVRDAARLAQSQGLATALITNGTCDPSVAEQILRYIDAVNVDLKGFTKKYYDWVHGNLEETKDFIERAYRKCHVEVTNLIVPERNDSEEEVRDLSEWLSWISYGLPLHITKYFPRYRVQIPAPEDSTLHHLADVARENLKYVFV